jgi:transposase
VHLFVPTVYRFRCLPGVDTLTGAGIHAEIGDRTRFAHPKHVASYLGIELSEHSTGDRHRRSSIRKAGSGHARRLVVEASWHYRHRRSTSSTLKRRQRGHDPRVIDLAWRAQRRLHQRWETLASDRGKPRNVVCVAVARELSGFQGEAATLD